MYELLGLEKEDIPAIEYVKSQGIHSVKDILEVNRLLLFRFSDSGGFYRNHNFVVNTYLMPDYQDLPRLMDEFMWDYGTSSSIDLVDHFIDIHPFNDKNGSTARLIWYDKMIKSGYSMKEGFYRNYYIASHQRRHHERTA